MASAVGFLLLLAILAKRSKLLADALAQGLQRVGVAGLQCPALLLAVGLGLGFLTLGEALRMHDNDFEKAFDLYQRSRIARTARIVLSSREMGRLYHAKGVERLIRNDLWKGRTPERFYDAIEWLYGWNVTNCLAQD